MKAKEIEQKIDEGHLRVNVIFELVGKPREHVEQTIKAYVENVSTQEGVHLLSQEIDDVDELEEGVFSTIAETELLVENIEKLTWLAFNFSPASIELLEPEEIALDQRQTTMWLNDMLAKLHEVGMMQKNMQGQQDVLIKNFNAMTRNAILLATKETNEIEEIGKKVGLEEVHVKKFLDALEKENKIREEKGKYYLK